VKDPRQDRGEKTEIRRDLAAVTIPRLRRPAGAPIAGDAEKMLRSACSAALFRSDRSITSDIARHLSYM
jgi:hypothetical protein